MTLLDYVVSKYMPQQNQIIFMRVDEDSDFIITLKSKDYCADVFSFLNKAIDLSQLQARLSSDAVLEFSQVLTGLKAIGLIQSEDGSAPVPVSSLKPGIVVTGKFFNLNIELLTQDLLISAVTYSEGEACSPVGLTYCETNSGNANYPSELWECIPGPPPNWAAMGQSC